MELSKNHSWYANRESDVASPWQRLPKSLIRAPKRGGDNGGELNTSSQNNWQSSGVARPVLQPARCIHSLKKKERIKQAVLSQTEDPQENTLQQSPLWVGEHAKVTKKTLGKCNITSAGEVHRMRR